jgi:hypothetical protein
LRRKEGYQGWKEGRKKGSDGGDNGGDKIVELCVIN